MNISSSSSFVNNVSMNTSSFNTSRRGKNRMDSILISSNSTHFLENFGLPLPSMVKVAITNSTDHQKTTSRIDQNGFAWLVWGRKLYIWKHSQSDKRMTCRELVLPPSELVHNANLVCVVINNGIPACIAVSPEGTITYWPNVFNESMSISISAEIPGQECDSLTSNWPTGCILATTSGTVLLVKSMVGKGAKPSLICLPLALQKNWLGNFGKKMTAVLFNPVGGSGLEMKRAKVVVPSLKETSTQQAPKNNLVFLLMGPSIQTWNISSDIQQSLAEINGEDILRRLFFDNIWGVDSNQKGDLRGIQVWLLDLTCLHSRKIAILAAAKNSADSTNIVHFGIAIIDEQKARRPEETKFLLINHKIPYSEIDDDHLYSWKLFSAHRFFYVVTNDFLLSISDQDGSTDIFESTSTGGPFIGSGIVSGNVVLFVPKFGILQVSYASSSEQNMTSLLDTTLLEVRVPDHLSLSISQPHSINDDNINVYKSAFLNYCGKKLSECQEILVGLFPPTVSSLSPHDPIDLWTVGLCERLIDDAPVSDPRWVSSFGIGSDHKDHLGLKSKILIKNFLMDKKEGLELFFGFLNGTGILGRLTGTVIKEDVVSTTSVLYNCYEKIGFALALQNLQSDNTYRATIDAAVKSIIQSRPKTHRSTNLTPNDLFYKDVSKVHHIVQALVAGEELTFSSKNPSEIAQIVKHTNEIILTAIVDTAENLIDRVESVKGAMVNHLLGGDNQYEYIPWIVQPSVLNCLVKQHEFTVRFMNPDLVKQLQQITDLILYGLKTNMESLVSTDRYIQKVDAFEKMRLKLLKSHIAFDIDGARTLAEKYIDYDILVNICYDKKEFDQLQLYFEKFGDFPEYVFEWYVKHKKHTELLETFSLGKFSNRLKVFIKKYPQIAWHHSTITEDFQEASSILSYLSANEESYLVDKEFMLCMSMLASVAAEDHPNLDQYERSLELVKYQNGLSDDILTKYGMERDTMRVLTPSEIIDFYTTENETGNEEDFFQAWSVCDFLINIDLRDEKRMVIITRAILADPWGSWPTDHPTDVIQSSLMYRFAMGLFARGEALDTIFPYSEMLEMEVLEPLLANENAKFLLSACHEHLSFAENDDRTLAPIEMEM